MNLRDLAGRLDRLQRTRSFKLIATGVLTGLALILIIGAVVNEYRPADLPAVTATPAAPADEPAGPEQTLSNTDAAGRLLSGLTEHAATSTGFIIGVLAVTGLCLAVVWLGVGLTYLGLLAGTAALVLPLSAFSATRPWATLVGGVSSLAVSFTVLMQALRTLFGGRGPVSAIARNVLAEAVRLKLSLVFVVLLIFGLAALPGLLDPDQPLRYRVQSFLQYGTGGTFWIIALLVVTFSVSTVATEQRDKVLWQTITKPVSPWQYLLGKWLGVSGLAALLLAVNTTGVFLFVEYLRYQPAQGEREAFVALADSGISEDRQILERQILTARRTVPATFTPIDEAQVQEILAQRAEEIRQRDPAFELTPEIESDMRKDLDRAWQFAQLGLAPGETRLFVFEGLDLPPDSDVPLTLSYRIDADANRPDVQYRVSFGIGDVIPVAREVGLGHSHSLPLAPSVLLPPQRGSPVPIHVLADEAVFPQVQRSIEAGLQPGARVLTSGQLVQGGALQIALINGEVAPVFDRATGEFSDLVLQPNPSVIQLPPGTLTVSYPVGSYHANFFKAVFVLWLKLAFLAMLGITASTFLSFSVASLVTFGVFLIAESAPFIKDSLKIYATVDREKNVDVFKVAISAIAHAASWAVYAYGELAPVKRLVAGENVGLAGVAKGVGLIAAWIGVLFAAAVTIFKRRELAIYSGN